MRIKVTLVDHPENPGAQKDFTIVITDTCETPTVTASSLSNEVYVIGTGAASTPAFAAFTFTPVYCPITYSMSSISPALPTADPSAITLDATNRLYSFNSVNLPSKALYTVTTTALTPLGVDTGVSFDFTVDF